jgi:hypothetical protein
MHAVLEMDGVNEGGETAKEGDGDFPDARTALGV